MNHDAQASLATIRNELDRVAGLRADLPRLREKLGDELFKFDKLEARVNELDEQVQSLEAFSFTSLASAIKGDKKEKLSALKEELLPLTEKYRSDLDVLEQLNDQVQSIEHEVEGFRQLEKGYQQACDAVAEEVLSTGGESAQQLAEIEDQYQQVKAEHRALTKAVEAAEQTENHLDSMTRSLGKARTKMTTYASPLGAIGQVAHQAYSHSKTKGPIRLVRQGVERLKRYIDELPLDEDIEINRDLRALSITLAETAAKLSENLPAGYFCDMGVTLPIKQDVRLALSHCERLKKELNPKLEALEQQRRTIIESAV